ncbi:hypothetical protein [Collimonas antrihumi]|uniref:hypothetical protein n=1 Tax=Collimonas antrihumi TaxID=1940615 RepID=UPI001B8B716A|nr:hypothetical protein [Collimonas antrihumi]
MKRLMTSILIVGAGLALSACGGSDGSSSNLGGTPTPAPAPAPAPAPVADAFTLQVEQIANTTSETTTPVSTDSIAVTQSETTSPVPIN